jgi:asparagine synthase (glutamine-hydrolysing)
MCGIAGYVGRVPPSTLSAMLRTLKHRGPDDDGAWLADDGARVGLGMTRLAIIDLVTGRQPMTSPDGHLHVVFNGEIYNFRDLRTRFAAAGRSFATTSDTEVILAAYERHGDACVEHLRGMFAFALWDGQRRRLLLARDRLGKKPLYYWRGAGVLLFASEIKALLCHPQIARTVDWDALHHYLAFGYTPADRSMFAGIAKLPPGHLLRVDSTGDVEHACYWSLPDAAATEAARVPAEEAPALVRHELREAVRLRLQSDVPLGVFLSGGIDSSAIVASAREVTSGRLSTFTVGFGPAAPSFDERRYAREVAERFATDHHEETLHPVIADVLPSVVRHFDEPFADSSALPTFMVAQATARHVKVALSGIGGDETFAGYPRYLGLRVSEGFARLPRGLRTLSARAAQRLLPESETSSNWGDRLRRFAAGAERPPFERYVRWTRFFTDEQLEKLVVPGVRACWRAPVDAAHRAAWAGRGYGDPVDGAFRVDLVTYLPDDLLAMADRMSMAHSLELRAPFCDHRLIERSLAIAPRVKLPGVRLKGLLRQAFATVLPPSVVRRRKQGFMIPLARWLRTDLRPLMEQLLAPDVVAARGLFSPAAVDALIQEHLGGRKTHADRLWALMMTELWLREYLDGTTTWKAGT